MGAHTWAERRKGRWVPNERQNTRNCGGTETSLPHPNIKTSKRERKRRSNSQTSNRHVKATIDWSQCMYILSEETTSSVEGGGKRHGHTDNNFSFANTRPLSPHSPLKEEKIGKNSLFPQKVGKFQQIQNSNSTNGFGNSGLLNIPSLTLISILGFSASIQLWAQSSWLLRNFSQKSQNLQIVDSIDTRSYTHKWIIGLYMCLGQYQ